MPPKKKRGRVASVDPFVFLVTESTPSTRSRVESDAPASPAAEADIMTLRKIAYEKVNIPLQDLRLANCDPIASMPADAPLPIGTKVQLPVVLDLRGSPYGLTTVLGKAEEELQRCDELLSNAVTTWEAANGQESLLHLPPRTVYSKVEQLLRTAHAEATRQLPAVENMLRALGNKDTKLPYLVDVNVMRAAEEAIDKDFTASTLSLESYKPENASVTQASSGSFPLNYITPELLHTTRDSSEDFCVRHTHRWEITMYGSRSKEPREVWAVLSCQKLTTLIDAVDCSTTRDPYKSSRNAFLFINGTFYIDNRHREDSDFEDLSAVIRESNPLDTSTTNSRLNSAFGRCQVLSAETAEFKDLTVKMGEFYLLRHCGGCDHYFSFTSVRSLQGCSRRTRDQFPCRVAKRRDLARRCVLCHLFPSTVVVYEDPLSTESPAYYCGVCFDILHSRDTPEQAKMYWKREAKESGELYFKMR